MQNNRMLTNILLLHLPLTPGVESKVKLFSFLKVVILHIKLIGMKHRTPCKQIFCPFTHSRHTFGQKVKKNLKKAILHITLCN